MIYHFLTSRKQRSHDSIQFPVKGTSETNGFIIFRLEFNIFTQKIAPCCNFEMKLTALEAMPKTPITITMNRVACDSSIPTSTVLMLTLGYNKAIA